MRAKRRGFTIVELMTACALTAILVALCVQLLGLTAAQRRAAERRAIALQEAANVIESIQSLPWHDLTPKRLAEYRLSEPARQVLAQGDLRITVEPLTSEPSAKRAQVEVTWPNGSGRDSSVQLSTWVYSREKEETP